MRQAWTMLFSKRRGAALSTITSVIVLALAALTLSGCISIPVGQASAAPATATAPLTFLDRLKGMPVVKATEDANSGDLPQFVTDSRNIACVFTTSRNGNLNQPWEPNNYSDSANAASPIIPVVNCEMARYPQAVESDIKDNCSGTSIGYLGGTVLLLPNKVTYGGCRAGVTAVEAAFGVDGTANEVMGKIPVLEDGQAMEADGYRCSPLDDGVACANLASGLGFFVSDEKYQLFGPGYPATPPAAGPTPSS